jgi:Mrp family chromosome partitioning ATPase
MPEPRPAPTPAESLGLYAAALRRWWPLALALIVLAAVTGFVVARQLPKSYEATARVLLDREREVEALLGTSEFASDPERELNTDIELITLDAVARDAGRSLGLREPASNLVGRVKTAVDRNSNIVSITARADDRTEAARIANAFATAYREYRARAARAAVVDALVAAEARLRRMAPGTERDELRGELRRLRVAGAFRTGGVQVVDHASPASASSRPRPLVSAVVGGFLGAIIAALAIVVLARTDRRVGGDGELERLADRPVLAHVPRTGATEELATLAVSLWPPRDGEPPRALVLLTSPGPGEGTAEVALGLARALGAVGWSAIAIEADRRAPAFAHALGLGATAGLSGILSGEGRLEDELAPLGEGAAALPAGAPDGLPHTLLAGPAMARLLEEAHARADIVLLAGGAFGGDALALAGLADTVLLVARPDTTRVDDLERAVRALARADAAPAGIVTTSRAPGGVLRAARRALARRRVVTPADTASGQPGGTPASKTSEVTVG